MIYDIGWVANLIVSECKSGDHQGSRCGQGNCSVAVDLESHVSIFVEVSYLEFVAAPSSHQSHSFALLVLLWNRRTELALLLDVVEDALLLELCFKVAEVSKVVSAVVFLFSCIFRSLHCVVVGPVDSSDVG